MVNIFKKIISWLFLGPDASVADKTDTCLRVLAVNIISVVGATYISLFFTLGFIKGVYSPLFLSVALTSSFLFTVSFIITHTHKGMKYFDYVRLAVIVNIMSIYGFIYANIAYGNTWAHLIPSIVILLMEFRLGLIFCFIYFLFMLFEELVFNLNPREVFVRLVCVFWAQVALISAYEALRKSYDKRMLKDKKEIEVLSITDHLTKLYNRRYFSESIHREFARAARQGESLCFLMIDVDKFKDYNDTYGHLQGDELLVAISELFKKSAKRPCDLVFRMGGEEFGILLPNTDGHGASLFAEKLRTEVSEMRVALLESSEETKTTVSIGVACLSPKSGEALEKLLKLADKNLYKAKEMGRNRVIS